KWETRCGRVTRVKVRHSLTAPALEFPHALSETARLAASLPSRQTKGGLRLGGGGARRSGSSEIKSICIRVLGKEMNRMYTAKEKVDENAGIIRPCTIWLTQPAP